MEPDKITFLGVAQIFWIIIFFIIVFMVTWKVFNWFLSLEDAVKTNTFTYYLKKLLTAFFVAMAATIMLAQLTFALIIVFLLEPIAQFFGFTLL